MDDRETWTKMGTRHKSKKKQKTKTQYRKLETWADMRNNGHKTQNKNKQNKSTQQNLKTRGKQIPPINRRWTQVVEKFSSSCFLKVPAVLLIFKSGKSLVDHYISVFDLRLLITPLVFCFLLSTNSGRVVK